VPLPPPKKASVFSIAYYQPMFDVSTAQVQSRILKSMWPFSSNQRVFMEDKYDLYGPIWIMITLIVFSCVFGYFSHKLQETIEGKPS